MEDDSVSDGIIFVIIVILGIWLSLTICSKLMSDDIDMKFTNSVRYVENDNYGRPRFYTYKNINQECAEAYGYSRPGHTIKRVKHIVHINWIKYLTLFYDDDSVVCFYYDRPDASSDTEFIFDKWSENEPLHDNTVIGTMKRPPIENRNAFISCLEQDEPLHARVKAVNVVNDAIKENNQKIDETKQLLKNKKTKLTVKAEIEDGFTVKETEIELTVDSLGNSDIDLASHAIRNILAKED
jgi:hypothetical protein